MQNPTLRWHLHIREKAKARRGTATSSGSHQHPTARSRGQHDRGIQPRGTFGGWGRVLSIHVPVRLTGELRSQVQGSTGTDFSPASCQSAWEQGFQGQSSNKAAEGNGGSLHPQNIFRHVPQNLCTASCEGQEAAHQSRPGQHMTSSSCCCQGNSSEASGERQGK